MKITNGAICGFWHCNNEAVDIVWCSVSMEDAKRLKRRYRGVLQGASMWVCEEHKPAHRTRLLTDSKKRRLFT